MDVPGWAPRERAERERFARTVATPETGGTATDTAERTTAEEHELALVAALRGLGELARPDEQTRERIRAGIVERLGAQDELAARRRRRPSLGGLVAAAAAVLLVLGGLGLLLSKDALPGDSLYQVKRAGEATSLGLTFDQQEKARKHLEFATLRLDEVRELRAGEHPDDDFRTALSDFDSEARAGTMGLTMLATRDGGPQLAELRGWAHTQSDRLTASRALLPPTAASWYAESTGLLSRIESRAAALGARMSCYLITSGASDDLGALPAVDGCAAPAIPGGTGQPGQTPPSGSGAPAERHAQSASSAPSAAPRPGQPEPGDQSGPTAPLPRQTGAPAPTAINPDPRLSTRPGQSNPQLPISTPGQPPLISLPPVLPSLPGIGIG